MKEIKAEFKHISVAGLRMTLFIYLSKTNKNLQVIIY